MRRDDPTQYLYLYTFRESYDLIRISSGSNPRRTIKDTSLKTALYGISELERERERENVYEMGREKNIYGYTKM